MSVPRPRTRSMRCVPVTLEVANLAIRVWHRHHQPVPGSRFAIGAVALGRLVGVAVVGRPVARMTDQASVAEVIRTATDGTKNVCSFLLGAAARVCREMGFSRIQTFTLPEEGGASLRASGWIKEGSTDGGMWGGWASRPVRNDGARPIGSKWRWAKDLNPPVGEYALPELPDLAQEAFL